MDKDWSVGQKFDQDKPRMDLLDSSALEELSKVLTFGAKKYAAHNWRKGITTSRLIAAALRHIFAYLGGQNNDPETGLSHIAHAMCCCMFILGLKNKTEMDDRYFVVPTSQTPLEHTRTPEGPWGTIYGYALAQSTGTSSSLVAGTVDSLGSPVPEPSACIDPNCWCRQTG